MDKKNKQQKKKQARASTSTGVSLERFAKAKTSKYDKRARAEEKRALKTQQKGKYRKLKSKLEKQGRLEPLLRPSDEERIECGPNTDTLRALARAGPALEDDGSGSDGIGDASPSSSGRGGMEDTVFHSSEKQAVAGRAQETATPEAQTRLPGSNDMDEEKKLLPAKIKQKKVHKRQSQLQQLAATVQAKKDKKQAERDKAHKEAEDRRRRIVETEKQRSKQKEKFLKRTKSGQPVMKHRVDKLLSKLQAEAA